MASPTLTTSARCACVVVAAYSAAGCRLGYDAIDFDLGGAQSLTSSRTVDGGSDASGEDAGAPNSADTSSSSGSDPPFASGGNEGGTSSGGSSSGGPPAMSTETVATSGAGGTAVDASTPPAAVSSDGGGAPVDSFSACTRIRRLAAPPDLNGDLEPGLERELVTPLGWSGQGALPSETSLSIAVAWHETGVYFYFEVVDAAPYIAGPADPVWYGDGVEIYVDHDGVLGGPWMYDAPGTKQMTIIAPADSSSTSTRAEMFTPPGPDRAWPGSQWYGKGTTTGYQVEGFVVADDLDLASWTLTEGGTIGIDVGHNVSFPNNRVGAFGHRMGQYFMSVVQPYSGLGNDLPFINPSAFCTPVLGGY